MKVCKKQKLMTIQNNWRLIIDNLNYLQFAKIKIDSKATDYLCEIGSISIFPTLEVDRVSLAKKVADNVLYIIIVGFEE